MLISVRQTVLTLHTELESWSIIMDTEIVNAQTGEVIEAQSTEVEIVDVDFTSEAVKTTLDLNDIDAQDDALAAMSTAEGVQDKLTNLPNKDKDAGIEFTLVDFISIPSQLPEQDAQGNPTGRMLDARRTVLMSATGEAFSTHSKPVYNQLMVVKTLRDRAGVQLRDKPVKVRLVHSLTSNKRQVIALQIVKRKAQ